MLLLCGVEAGHLWDDARERRRGGLLLPLPLLLLLLVEAAAGRENRPAAPLERQVRWAAVPAELEGARPGPADEGQAAQRGVLLRWRGRRGGGRRRVRLRRGGGFFVGRREGGEGGGVQEGDDRREGLGRELGPIRGDLRVALFLKGESRGCK